MKRIARRNLMKGGAALALAAATIPTGAAPGTAELDRLIEAHQAAYEAYGHALDREDQALSAEVDAAMNAEIEALSAVCAYRCRTIEEAQRKAEHLVWHVETGNVSDEQMEAVLKSFLRAKLEGAQ